MKTYLATPLLLGALTFTGSPVSALTEETGNRTGSTTVPVAGTPAAPSASSSTTGTGAMSMPEMPKPTKEHEWLKKFEGEWTYEAEFNMPGMPPIKSTGTETVRNIGGFWVMLENNGKIMGSPFTGIMTLGYSPEKKKYVGSWIDSSTSNMWTYEGTLDDTGNKLTLNTEGPCPMQGGKIVKMQEIIEFKSPDVQVFTSRMDDNGKWITGATITSTRKK